MVVCKFVMVVPMNCGTVEVVIARVVVPMVSQMETVGTVVTVLSKIGILRYMLVLKRVVKKV